VFLALDPVKLLGWFTKELDDVANGPALRIGVVIT
jgi:hypothetical protein